jgi:autotransporter-associated beta strand protein
MRRELLFSLLGFLGGFVVAGIVFWQPSVSEPGPAPHSPDAAAVHRGTSAGGGGVSEHGRRPLVVAAGENAVSAPVAEGGPQAKSVAEIFHEALGTLADMEQNKRQKAIETLVKQLRAAGPEGLQVMRDFFHAGSDVKLQNGYLMVNGKVTQTPSLRSSLLFALGEWDGKEALDLTREILQTTPRMFEASMAISQLEKRAPGVYREEAIRTLQQLADAQPEKDAWANGGNALFDAMKYFKATELVPAAEASAAKNPWSTVQFVQALDAMPSDVRTPALQRLFANENVVKNLSTNPWMLQGLNYSEPVVAQNVAQIFEGNTDKKFRENFLTNFFSQQRQVYYGTSGLGSTQTPSTAERVTQLQGKLSFLDQIAPQCTTPVLQERLQDARTEVQKAIANPEDNGLTKRGSGTLIFNGDTNAYSGGTTIITDGSIQVGTTTDRK